MQIRKLNPWTDPEGMDQGVMIGIFNRQVFVSGQCPAGPDGASLAGRPGPCCP